MKQRLFFVLMTLCLILLGQGGFLYAQAPRSLEIGPHVGASTTLNDINTWKLFWEPDLEYGALARLNYDSRWAFRLDYSHSVVKSSDSIAQWRPERDLSFRSVINDISLVVEFNFLDYYTGKIGKGVSPYIFGGVSLFWYKTAPNLNKAGQQELMGTVNDHNAHAFDSVWNSSLGRNTSFSIPFGIGCKFSISKHLAASVEWMMHYTLTDGIDGIANRYPATNHHQYFVTTQEGYDANNNPIMNYNVVSGSPADFGPDVINYMDLTDPTGLFQEGQQRGNSQSMDWFGSLRLSLTWKIPLPGGTACRIENY